MFTATKEGTVPKGKYDQTGVDSKAAPFSKGRGPGMSKGGRYAMQKPSSGPSGKTNKGYRPKGNQSGVQSHRY